MARRGRSGLTSSAIPSLNTILPEPALAIKAGQNLRAGALELNQAERRESLAVRMSGGGPDGLRAMVEMRSVDPETWMTIVQGQGIALENEAKQLGIEKKEMDLLLSRYALMGLKVSQLMDVDPARAQAAVLDFNAQNPEMGLSDDPNTFAADSVGVALTARDRAERAQKDRSVEQKREDTKAANAFTTQRDKQLQAGRIELEEHKAKLEGAGGASFGSGVDGQAMEIIAQGEKMRQKGEEVSEDFLIDEQMAAWRLQQPRLQPTGDGSMAIVQPELPSLMMNAPSGQELGAGGAVAAGVGTAPGSGLKITPIQAKATAKQINVAFGTIEAIKETLNEARRAGDNITGWYGALSAGIPGKVIRQFLPGVISTRARTLDNQLKTLQSQLGPAILTDPRISNEDQERIKQLVSDLDAWTGEQDIRIGLADMVRTLARLQEVE